MFQNQRGLAFGGRNEDAGILNNGNGNY